MNKLLTCTILGSTLLSFSAQPAYANDTSSNEGRFYGKIYGGANFLGDKSFDQNGVASAGATGDGSYDSGWLAGAAAGYYITENIAAELAWDYRTNNNDSVNFSDSTSFSDGNFASNTFFINGYYHFDKIKSSKFRPYLGAGLGYVEEIDMDLESGGTEVSYSDDGKFAYQLIAGTSYELSNHWDLTTDLRYMRVSGLDLENESGTGTLRDVNYNPVSLTFGATYKF